MSLLVTGIFAAAGMLIGGFVGRRVQKRREEKAKLSQGDAKTSTADASEEGPSSGDDRGTTRESRRVPAAKGTKGTRPPAGGLPPGFPCQLGDVLLTRVGDEAWLAGAWVLEEEVPVAAIFFGPDAGGDRVVYVRSAPKTSVFWLAPVSGAEVPTGGEPPTALELGGDRYERTRRVPFRLARVGTGAPDVEGTTVVSEYAGEGPSRLVILSGLGPLRAFVGEELLEGSYEFIAAKSE